LPSLTGTYSTTGSTSACNFKCASNYNWNGSSCEAATQTGTCTGLPANAQRNTVSSITQTRNGSQWLPSVTGSYSTTGSTSACNFKCASNYNWNGNSCEAGTQTGTCTGLPTNAQRNTVSSITQTRNGNQWLPSVTGSYSTTESTSACNFKCASNYNWNGSSCEAALPPAGVYHNTGAGTITVSDGTTTYTIMDKNLGTGVVVGTGPFSYGSYFQRGNNYGFANSGSITTSNSLVPNASSYGPSPLFYYSGSNFITEPGVSNNSKYDYWKGGQNNNLR
jgi:hypothetical protein